jgi:CHASE1-domain containing sensor protein
MEPLNAIKKDVQASVDGFPRGKPVLGWIQGNASRLFWSALIIIGSLGFYLYSQNERRRSLFERESSAVINGIVERFKNYEDGLWAGVSFIQALDYQIGHNEWRKFETGQDLLRRYPGINGVGVIFSVRKRELAKFVAAQRVTRPEFNIHPEHLNQEHLPITFIEPLMGNEKAVGLDVAFEAHRLEGAMRAKMTGLAQITAPIALVQDQGKTPGFLYYAPYYDTGGEDVKLWTNEKRQENFIGMTYMPIIMNKFIHGVRANGQVANISVKIYDGEDLLFSQENQYDANFDPTPLFLQKVDLLVAGRKWTVHLRSTKTFRGQ